MLRRWRQWLALPLADRMTTMAMAVALPTISLGLSLFGYVRLRRWLERMSARDTVRDATPDDIASAQRLARLASIAGTHGPIEATCLRQSLLLHFLLRRKQLAPELMIGVRKQDGAFDAHAWVQLGGVALGQQNLAHTALPDRPETA